MEGPSVFRIASKNFQFAFSKDFPIFEQNQPDFVYPTVQTEMIENKTQLLFSEEQLEKVRSREKEIANDSSLDSRLKESKLAGIRSMIGQIEQEIRAYNLVQVKNAISELEEQVQGTDVEQMPELLRRTIRVMRDLTNATPPA